MVVRPTSVAAADVLDGGDHCPAPLGDGDLLRLTEDPAVEDHVLGFRPGNAVLTGTVFQRRDGLEPPVRAPVRPVVQPVASAIG